MKKINWMINHASRTENVHYAIRDVAMQVSSWKNVIPLHIGDPAYFDLRTPKHLYAAVRANPQKTEAYADALGLLEAREAIAREAKKKGMNKISSDNVVMGVGSSGCIATVLASLVGRGENLLIPRPGYPLYASLLMVNEAKGNEYDLEEENNWLPDPEQIRKQINKKTKGIVVINPNNPTGTLCPKSTIKKIIDVAGEFKIPILADEIYDRLIFNDDHSFRNVASLTKDVPVLSFNGLSKAYHCPGWRVGWVIFSGNSQPLEKIKATVAQLSRCSLGANAPEQYAVKAALEGSQKHILQARKKMKERAEYTYHRLKEMQNISVIKPQAAFYIFPRIETKLSDKEFAIRLFEKTNVLTVHGAGFSQKPGTKHLRLVTLPPLPILKTACDRIENFMKNNI